MADGIAEGADNYSAEPQSHFGFAAKGDLQGIFDCGQDQEHSKKV